MILIGCGSNGLQEKVEERKAHAEPCVAPTEGDYGWKLSVLQGSEASCTGEATEKGNEP